MHTTRRALMGAGLAFAVAPRGAYAAEISFPFRVLYNVPFTAVAINDAPVLPFLLDSNGIGLVIDEAEAVRLALPKGPAMNFGGSFKVTQYQAKKVLVGGALMMADEKLTAFPARAGEITKGRAPLTRGAPVGVDFQTGRVRFMANEVAKETEGWENVSSPARDVARNSISRQFFISATLDGAPVRLRVDTANAGGVTLASRYVEGKGMWDAYPGALDVKAAGFSPARRLAKAARLQIGKYAFASPIVALTDPKAPAFPTAGASAASDPAAGGDSGPSGPAARGGAASAPGTPQKYDGVIGMEMLRRLNIVIDPRFGGRVWVNANAAIADGFHYDRAGMAIDPSTLQVTDVAAGAPAEKAGLKSGDKITAWRGAGAGAGLIWALQGAPGAKVAVQTTAADGANAMHEIVLAERL